MGEPAPSQSLAEKALARLRKIASGNDLKADSIQVIETKESIINIKGEMDVSSMCETASITYPGEVKGKDRKTSSSFATLHAAVEKHQKEFRERADWIGAVRKEISEYDSHGWGLDKAKVTLPEQSAVYAASEVCPSCGGRKLLTCEQCLGKGEVICTQCQGQGREPCYYCSGRGDDPQRPGQMCPTCNGTRMAPCRFCQTRGYLSCPTCGGKRGTPCKLCQAAGKITQEVHITCGAETHFKMIADGLPSGLRRGLDRIGIANIGKGHADVSFMPAQKEEGETTKSGAPIPLLRYDAAMPYAELRMLLGKKKADISVVGKRCAITGVPYFLDAPLTPWMEKLRAASLGQGAIESAIAVRAIKDALLLCVSGKGRVQELRRLYPFGMSSDFMKNMISYMTLALNKTTLKTRAVVAVVCVVVCLGLFYVWFNADAIAQGGAAVYKRLALDVIVLGAALVGSWAVLNFAVRFVLKRRFPQASFSLHQKIGKTGLSMLAGIVLSFILAVAISPIKPAWLVAVFIALRE